MTGIQFPIDGVVYCPPADAARYFETGAWVDDTLGGALRKYNGNAINNKRISA